MDFTGRSAEGVVTTILFLCCFAFPFVSAASRQDQIDKVQGQRELLPPARAIDRDYDLGLSLARLEQWREARKAFLSGYHLHPKDKRFPIELAGVAFKQKKYTEAARWLRRALRLDPKDAYANDFLATVYFLQGNLEAALKYWNRVGKPRIEQVRTEPALHVNPALLDHAFAFSPASVLKRNDLLASEARLNALEIFPSYRLDLLARLDEAEEKREEGEKFDVEFRAQENNGFGNTKIQALLRLFRGLPYQAVNPEYFNIGGSATNWISFLRWDAQKRRADSRFSGPFLRSPQWRFRLGMDLREENWDIRKSFTGPSPVLAGFSLRREAASAEIMRLVGSRWSWTAGAELSHRDYQNVFSGNALTPSLLAQGYALSENARLDYKLLRMPEERLSVDGALSAKTGRLWSTPTESFTKVQAALQARWLPRSQNDDNETKWSIRAGDTLGQAPFDELFMLGMERDNDLWLRGHIGTRDGRKGSAPMGSRYLLSNWETDKNLYRNGVVTLKLGPFLDSGSITGSTPAIGSSRWLWDAGVQCKVSVLGMGIALIYGKDLRTGNNAFYTATGQ